MLCRIYRKIVHEIKLKRAIVDAYWLQQLKYFGLTDLAVSATEAGKLLVKPLDIKLSPVVHVFMLEGYNYVSGLLKIGAKFSINQNQQVQIKTGDLHFEISSKQELFILNEIYVQNCYNYIFNGRSIVVDIGFNVGFTSLFFAQNRLVDHVYAFEPFATTFVLGMNNLDLNPQLRKKITAYNFGLGIEDMSFTAKFDDEKKGNNIAAPSIGENDRNVEMVSVRDITRVFGELGIFASDKELVVKMDCEGGEYELIQKLDSDGLLSKIKVFMIEWHAVGPDPIESTLINNGFRVFSNRDSMELGFIYAIKSA